jgi:hypothetical protein
MRSENLVLTEALVEDEQIVDDHVVEIFQVVVVGVVAAIAESRGQHVAVGEHQAPVLLQVDHRGVALVADERLELETALVVPAVASHPTHRGRRGDERPIVDDRVVVGPEIAVAVVRVRRLVLRIPELVVFAFDLLVAVTGGQDPEAQVLLRCQRPIVAAEDVPVLGAIAFSRFPFLFILADQAQEQVEVAAPRGPQPAAALTLPGSGGVDVGEADAERQLFPGAGIDGRQVEHAGEPVALLGREAAGRQVHAPQYLGVDDAEDALEVLQVIGLEDLDAVEVLAGILEQAPTDIELCTGVIARHTGHQGQGPVDVVAQSRQGGQLLGRQRDRRDRITAVELVGGGHVDFGEKLRRRQGDLEGLGLGRDTDGLGVRQVAIEYDSQDVGSDRQRHGEGAIGSDGRGDRIAARFGGVFRLEEDLCSAGRDAVRVLDPAVDTTDGRVHLLCTGCADDGAQEGEGEQGVAQTG